MLSTNPASQTLQFHELLSPSDPHYEGWLSLYRSAFPQQELLAPERLREIMERKASGESCEVSQLAVLNGENQLAAMAIYRVYADLPLAYLWYLAVNPDQRGQGTGALVYQRILAACPPGTLAMIFEVERPELAFDEQQRLLRQRRIRFYQRLGACVLEGLSFTIHPDPATPPQAMHLMVHRLQPIPVEQMLALLQPVTELENLRQIGPLRFAGLEQG